MQYFVRAMEMLKNGPREFSAEVACAALSDAITEAKRQVLASSPDRMLQADACIRNRGTVVTKYRCRLDERGELHEYMLG